MAEYISMKQVPNGTVTAKDDRIVYDANLADCGIIYGCEISYIGNNMIHINAGYGIIKGGLFEIEDHIEYVEYARTGSVKGQIYLRLDLAADDKLVIVKETTNTLHPMVKDDDANFTNGVYEMQLCTFTATPTTLNDVTQTFSVVNMGVLDSLEEIQANTTGGLKAGALAVKQLKSNVIAQIGDMKITSEGSGANTKYYIQKGADSASKKQLGNMKNIPINMSMFSLDNYNYNQDAEKTSLNGVLSRVSNGYIIFSKGTSIKSFNYHFSSSHDDCHMSLQAGVDGNYTHTIDSYSGWSGGDTNKGGTADLSGRGFNCIRCIYSFNSGPAYNGTLSVSDFQFD